MNKEDVVYIYNRILLSHKKNEILPFEATWMDLEVITLSEISQRRTNMISLVCGIKKINQQTQQQKKQTHREQSSNYQWAEGRGEGQDSGRRLRCTNYYA